VTARLAVAYVVLFAISAGLAATSFKAGAGRKPEPKLAGVYRADLACAAGEELRLEQSGRYVDATGALDGKLESVKGHLTGDVRCGDGDGKRPLDVRRSGTADRPHLAGSYGAQRFEATFLRDLPKIGRTAATKGPKNEVIFGRLMLAIAAVILAARLFRLLVGVAGQPPVMGEVVAGILLGPTLLGAFFPGVFSYLFPPFVIPLLNGAADIGLAFYMFLVGLELDPRILKGRIGHAAAISNASIVLPLGLGILVALPLYHLLAPPAASFQGFALFMGVAMSITAFPVLARLLMERRMLTRRTGALALSAAAVDDITAWGLLAIASAITTHGSAVGTLPVLGYVFAFCAAMALLARPLLNRVSRAYDEAGEVPSGWIAAIFVGVLLASFVSMKAGVAPIFGAFVMGLVMPRRADLSHDVTRRLEDFIATVLLPLFFVVTGLKTDVGLLNRWELWLIAGLLLLVAIAGKWLGAMLIARVVGYGWRESGVLGALMNTRGLTELIVLNVGLELGVISTSLFTMLVLMALVTTFMAAPAIRLLDPRGDLAAPVEEELQSAVGERPPEAPEPEGAILVAPLAERNVDELLAIAEPLALGIRPREVLLVRPLAPPRVPTQLAASDRDVEEAQRALSRLRSSLSARGIPTRTLAFTSGRAGSDVVRLAREEDVDLLLVDGRRPLLGAGPPRGDVATILREAGCDVGVLMEREQLPPLDAEHPVVVAYDGAQETALDVARQLAEGTGAPLRIVDGDGRLAEEAATAGLVVVELSPAWRKEGLGAGRASVAGTGPTLLVRPAAVPSS
jgi:Kef-type K+ transport system membrane component KefB